jgi:hypothetical protein
MGYATVDDLRRILPEKVTIGNSNIGVPTPNAQGSNRSNISSEEAVQYIEYATTYLDGRLRPFYSCPLRRIKQYETDVLSNPSHGDLVSITVNDSGSFLAGNLIRIQNYDTMETAIVTSTPNLKTVVVDHLNNNYLSADNTKISIIKYPDPVPLVVAQMAASLLLDRLFVSQNSPDVSEFGKTQRNLARSQIENILSGEVLLFGQEFTGRRFCRITLLDAFSSPAEVQKGVEKE